MINSIVNDGKLRTHDWSKQCISLLSVETPTRPCSVNHHVPVTSFPIGYLASYVTELTGCGSVLTSPWLIRAADGQTIHVTLFDFASRSQQLAATKESSSLCPVYAIISEVGDTMKGRHHNVTICGGSLTRERHVYSSLTNQITVGLTIDEFSDLTADLPYYLLKYEGMWPTREVK